MPRVVAIVNPASANGSTAGFWKGARAAFRLPGISMEEVHTEAPGHATHLARQAVEEGVDVVLYVGGDGTANEVVNGLMAVPAERRPPLACLPRGTGADLRRNLGLEGGAQAAATRLLRGRERRLDLAASSFTGHDGRPASRYFINIADAGLGGYVAEHANARSKALGGFASFLWAVVASFWTYEKQDMRVLVDGSVRYEGRVTTAVVANGAFFGGGMLMAPAARPDDGLLDIIVIGDVGKRDLATNLHRIYRGTHLTHPRISSFQGKEVFIEGPGHIPLQMDGEQPGTAPWRVRVAPAALRVLV